MLSEASLTVFPLTVQFPGVGTVAVVGQVDADVAL